MPFGSVNLNLRGPLPATRLWIETRAVAAEIAAALVGPNRRPGGTGWALPDAGDRPDPLAWLDSPPARHRQQVWIAVGMLTVHLNLNQIDALDELRALAFTHGQDLDHYADALVHRRVPLPDPDR